MRNCCCSIIFFHHSILHVFACLENCGYNTTENFPQELLLLRKRLERLQFDWPMTACWSKCWAFSSLDPHHYVILIRQNGCISTGGAANYSLIIFLECLFFLYLGKIYNSVLQIWCVMVYQQKWEIKVCSNLEPLKLRSIGYTNKTRCEVSSVVIS